MIEIERKFGTAINDLFRRYRHRSLAPQEAYDQAQLAILDVTQAFQDILPEKKVLKAIAKAKTPNAVSMAVRHRLPHFSAIRL